jgi:hypothetical protein
MGVFIGGWGEIFLKIGFLEFIGAQMLKNN